MHILWNFNFAGNIKILTSIFWTRIIHYPSKPLKNIWIKFPVSMLIKFWKVSTQCGPQHTCVWQTTSGKKYSLSLKLFLSNTSPGILKYCFIPILQNADFVALHESLAIKHDMTGTRVISYVLGKQFSLAVFSISFICRESGLI